MKEKTNLDSSKSEAKNSSNNKLKLALGGGITAILLIIVAGFLYVLLATDLIITSSYKYDSSLEESEAYFKDNTISLLDSIDFQKLDKKDPLGFININKIFEDFDKNSKKLDKLSIDESEILAGKTTQEILQIDSNGDFGGDGSGDSLRLDLEFFTSYPTDYKGEQLDSETISKIISGDYQAESVEKLKYLKMQVDGPIVYKDGLKELSMDISATIVDSVLYFSYDNLKMSRDFTNDLVSLDLASLEENEGKLIKVDLAQSIVSIQEYYSQYSSTDSLTQFGVNSAQIEKYTNDFLNKKDKTQTSAYRDLQTLLKVVFSQSTEYDQGIEIARRIGNPIKNVIKKEIRDTKIFVDVKEVEAIAQIENTKCYSGAVNLEGMIDSLENGTLSIFKILNDDKDLKKLTSDFEEMEKESEESFEEMRKSFVNSAVKVDISTCHNDDGMNGFGVNYTGKTNELTQNISMNYLLMNLDSEKEILVPKGEIVDLTDDWNMLVEGATSSQVNSGYSF